MPYTSFTPDEPDDEQYHTANLDYPELTDILRDRPPPERVGKTAAKQAPVMCALCNMEPITQDVGGSTVCNSCAMNQLGIPLSETQEPSQFGQPKFACIRCNGTKLEKFSSNTCYACGGTGFEVEGEVREAGFLTDFLRGKSREQPGMENAWSYDWCYLPNAPVLMGNGTEKLISEIQIGDEVITHLGNIKKVTWVGNREFDGELTHLSIQGDTTRKITATSNHRMWAANRDWALIGKRKDYIERYTGDRDTILNPIQDWIPIGNLKVGDYLSRSILSDEKPIINTYKCPVRYWDANYSIELFDIKIDEEIAWLLGIYAGDGHRQKKKGYDVWFEVGIDNGPITNRLIDIASKYFNVKASIHKYKDRNATKVRIAHWALNAFVYEMIGDGSLTKSIHADILTLPLSEQRAFIEGYLDSDGYLYKDGKSCISSISQMPYQVREILARLGIASNINPEGYSGYPNSKDSRRVIWYQSQYNKVSHFIKNQTVWQRIVDVEKEHYKGLVWDIEVEEDHSFRAYGMNTHNCRFRKNSHCFFPKELDTKATAIAGYAVWKPQDRGMCPRIKWMEQIACPISQPGPNSGDKNSLTDATKSWDQGGQRGGHPSPNDHFLPKAANREYSTEEVERDNTNLDLSRHNIDKSTARWHIEDVPLHKIQGYTKGKYNSALFHESEPEYMKSITDAHARGKTPPAAFVKHNDGQYWHADGAHRLMAAHDLGHTHIRSYVTEENQKQASFDSSTEESIDKVASYWDVQQKAKRLRQSGNVKLLETPQEGLPYIWAQVQGDHGNYHVVIERLGYKINSWICSCPFGELGPDGIDSNLRAPNSPLKNRKCSHVLAAAYEIQSRDLKSHANLGIEPFVVEHAGEQHTIIHLEDDILITDNGHIIDSKEVTHPDFDEHSGLDFKDTHGNSSK